MNNDKERLVRMRDENKITEAEYKLLASALEKKSSWANHLFILINPFQKIAGIPALIAGIVVILMMSYIGVIAQVYYPGILAVINATVVIHPKVEVGFLLLFYQNVVCWIVLTAVFIAASLLFKQKRIRIIDFLGTVALSRFPYLFLTLYLALVRVFYPSLLNIDLTKGLQLHPSVMLTIFSIVVVICQIWQIITYFYALKESSGLTGKKLWLSYIGALIIGECISMPLNSMFF